jgi:hypothetical protein
MNTDSPLDEILDPFYHETQAAVDITQHNDLKRAIELYCHKQVIEELEKIYNTRSSDMLSGGKIPPLVIPANIVRNRLAELRKTL